MMTPEGEYLLGMEPIAPGYSEVKKPQNALVHVEAVVAMQELHCRLNSIESRYGLRHVGLRLFLQPCLHA